MKKAIILATALIMQVAFSQGTGQPKKQDRFEYLDGQGIGAGWQVPAPAPPPIPKPELGPIDKWRYQSCQQGAATAPTSQGVIIKLRVCREKFGQ